MTFKLNFIAFAKRSAQMMMLEDRYTPMKESAIIQEDYLIQSELQLKTHFPYKEIFAITFAINSLPHELIIFGFHRLLGWMPKDIIDELSNDTLRRLLKKLENAFLEQLELGFSKKEIIAYLKPLRLNMDKMLEQIKIRPKIKEKYYHLVNRIVGDTILKEYYTSDGPQHDIKLWSYSVRRHVIAEIKNRGLELP